MHAARSQPKRREPQRTCVGCREVEGKRSLIRVVRSPEGIRIDPTGKMPGRGAYLHDRHSCWEKALKASLGRALKVELDEVAIATLSDYMNKLPDEQNG
jgi:predicted RNA-binding protein YlxR (DUF448 family)